LRSIAAKGGAGFTLVEVLVALAIVALSLSSIGTLIATVTRATRSLEERWARLEVARTLSTGLPQRDQLMLGHIDGELAGHRWRVEVLPYPVPAALQASAQTSRWIPQAVMVRVASPSGATVRFDTVRLHPRGKK
jgi:general secretion pathway protein I